MTTNTTNTDAQQRTATETDTGRHYVNAPGARPHSGDRVRVIADETAGFKFDGSGIVRGTYKARDGTARLRVEVFTGEGTHPVDVGALRLLTPSTPRFDDYDEATHTPPGDD